jgi:hypothetical protein
MAHTVIRLRLTAKAPRSVYVGFMADKVALGQVSTLVLRLSPVNIIPPWLSTHILPGG